MALTQADSVPKIEELIAEDESDRDRFIVKDQEEELKPASISKASRSRKVSSKVSKADLDSETTQSTPSHHRKEEEVPTTQKKRKVVSRTRAKPSQGR